MNILTYIVWNGSPDIFTIPIPFLDTQLTLRWYGLLFALGFLISQQLLYYMFRKEGKPEKDVDTLTIYMVIATIIGARLGHVLFYEPDRYLDNPIDILKIWEGGLASHGAAVGILFALWLYANYFISFSKADVELKEKKQGEGEVKTKSRYGFFVQKRKVEGQSYLQILDRIVILVALTGALIRIGNFFNSEIVGIETRSTQGVLFAYPVSSVLKQDGYVKDIHYVPTDTVNSQGYPGLKVLLEFDTGREFAHAQDVDQYLSNRIGGYWSFSPKIHENIDHFEDLSVRVGQDERQIPVAVLSTFAIPRHPAQLYEAASCILLFALLFWIWSRHKEKLPTGRIFGIFMIVLWSLRFGYEYLKENQVDFENNLPLNMGQMLSIPLVILGVIILVRSYRKAEN